MRKDEVIAPGLVVYLSIDDCERQKMRVKQSTGINSAEPEKYINLTAVEGKDADLNVFDFFEHINVPVLRLDSKIGDSALRAVTEYIETHAPVFNFSDAREVEAKARAEAELVQKRKELEVG